MIQKDAPSGIVTFVVSAFLLVLTIATFTWPMYWDHGILMWAGRDILEGGVPYQTTFDAKGPAAFLLYALAAALPFESAVAVRVADAVALLAVAALLANYVNSWIGPGPAAATALALVGGWFTTGFVNTAQADGWVGLVILGSTVFGVSQVERRPAWTGMATGFAYAMIVAVKPTFGIYLLLPVYGFISLFRAAAPTAWRFGMAFAGSALASLLGLLAWLTLRGGLESFWEAQLYTLTVYAPANEQTVRGIGRVFPLIKDLTAGSEFFYWPLLLPGIIAFFCSTSIDRPAKRLLALAIAAGAVNIAVQGKYLSYHWMPLLVVALPASAIGVYVATFQSTPAPDGEQRALRALAFGFAIIMATGVLLRPIREVGRFARHATRRLGQAEYLALYKRPGFEAVTDWQVAQYLARTTTTEDEVAIWGYETDIPLMANRRIPGRFVHSDALRQGSAPLVTRFRAEYRRTLEQARPARYIMTQPADGASYPADLLRSMPEFASWLSLNYEADTTIGGFHVLRLRAAASGSVTPDTR
jgi:hypothetical protein